MIKRSTLIVLLAAVVAGAAFYYFDWKRGEKETEKGAADTSKPAFSVRAEDISSFTLSYPADAKSQRIHFEKHDGAWQITEPLQTGADDSSVQGIIQQLSSVRIAATVPGAPDRLKAYGLDTPAVSLDFQLQNGSKHSVQLGKKDFTGGSVYAAVDGGKEVVLLDESLLASADRPLQQFRDHSVLHIVPGSVDSFELKNAAGEMAAAKDKVRWKFTKPAGIAGDGDAIKALLTAVSSATQVAIVSETPEKLGQYGLTNPAITFTASEGNGKTATLLVGKKDGGEYFARDAARPTIFRINEDLYKKLAENSSDLRDKKVAHFDPADMTHAEIHNANGAIYCTRKSEEEWSFDAASPADEKAGDKGKVEQTGKSVSLEKLFTPLEQARAEEVFDHPSSELAAKLSKPAFAAVLTDKSGKKLTVEISKESGGFVYARTSEAPAIYKLKPEILADLSFKQTDLTF